MNTNEKVLLCGTAGLLAYSVFRKVRATGNLIYLPGPVQGIDMVGITPVLRVGIFVQNTSGTSLRINSFAGQVIANETIVGNVYNFYPVQVPANGQTLLIVNCKLNLLGIVNDIVKAFQFGNTTQDVTIEGYANAGTFPTDIQIPIKLKFSIGG